MSHHYSIRNLLNIKDKNITFDENYVQKNSLKGSNQKSFMAN